MRESDAAMPRHALPSTADVWKWSAAEIAAAVRSGHVACVEVIEQVYERILATNGSVNAIVHMDREGALRRARQLDDMRRSGEPLGPLCGVPVSIKLNVDVKGEATTNGNPLWRDRIAPADSEVVQNLRRAGAIVIGRTNTPPYSFRWFTENPLYGRTHNPWSADVTSGGSSGGAGVSVAQGMCPIAHGTDIAGSIRYPAYVNGVVGLRATPGRIPARHPTSSRRFFGLQSMSAQGPLARNVHDARLALEAMAAQGSSDPLWVDARLRYDDDQTPVRVALVDEITGIEIDEAVRGALRRAAASLSAAGYRVERAQPPDLRRGVDLWEQIVMTESGLGMTAAVDAIGDPLVRRAVHNMAACAAPTDLAGYANALAERDQLRQSWSDFLAQYPLVLLPTSCAMPLPWGADQGSAEDMMRLLHIQSPLMAVAACGLPGLQVPIGVVDGLPVGVQLVAASFREMRLLNAGAVIEADHGDLNAMRWARRGPDRTV